MNHTRYRRLRAGAAVICAMWGFGCASAAESSAVAIADLFAAPAVHAPEPSIRFGLFAVTTRPQTVTIHPDGGRTLRGIQPAGVRQARRFGPAGVVVSGERGLMFSVALPVEAVLTTGSGSPSRDVLHVTDFRLSPPGQGPLTEGSRTLLLGATVSIPGSQDAGMYSGHAVVTVAYD